MLGDDELQQLPVTLRYAYYRRAIVRSELRKLDNDVQDRLDELADIELTIAEATRDA